jgi:hypothetical protein
MKVLNKIKKYFKKIMNIYLEINQIKIENNYFLIKQE